MDINAVKSLLEILLFEGMKVQKNCIVFKNLSGFHYPAIDPSFSGNKIDDKISLAVTMPHKNAVACIDIGYRSKSGWPFPFEELIHYITVLPMMNGMYPIVREDVKKIIDHDISPKYNNIEKITPLAEAIVDIFEEYSPLYHLKMDEYRKYVLNYFGTDDRNIFFRGLKMEKQINQEKKLLRLATENITSLYSGPKEQGIELPLLAMAIYTASSYPDHKKFLKNCMDADKPWRCLLGKDDFSTLFPKNNKNLAFFPLDQYHIAIEQTIQLVYDIIEYYSSYYDKIRYLTTALPPMISAIDFTMGMFSYFNFTLTFITSDTGRHGIQGNILPRCRKTSYDSSLTKEIVEFYGKEYDCLLCKSYNWIIDPNKSLDEMFATIGGTTLASVLTGYYSDRYYNLLDLMIAFEDTVIKGNKKCPHCEDMLQNLHNFPELEEILLKGYITKNQTLILSLFNAAAANLNSMLWNQLIQISKQYVSILNA